MMKVDSPLFSVIVPVYNNERDLKRCIESILAQSFKDFELIIVDDGSTDRTPQIIDGFAVQDDRVKVIHRITNGGVVAARNVGLFQALGKYIYYVDGDDWIDSELLETANMELSKEIAPDIFVFCHVKVQKDGKYVKNGLKIEKGMYDKKRLQKDVYPSMICRVERTIKPGIDSGALWDKIIKRDLLKKHYCKDTSLFRGEDSVCSWECIYYADNIYFSNLNMYFYNCMSSNSTKKQYYENLYENNKAVAKYLREHLKAKDDFIIERQINVLEFRGMMGVVHQEIDFHHSVWGAARVLKEKCKGKGKICSKKGVPQYVHLYISALNLHWFLLLLIYTILKRYFETAICIVRAKCCGIE